jgi:NADH-quinone oxidoreductase subunit J
MLLNLADAGGRQVSHVPGKVVGVLLLGVVFAAVYTAVGVPQRASAGAVPVGFGGVRRVGTALFGDYVLPFELAGVLLLGAILGTIVLARRKP